MEGVTVEVLSTSHYSASQTYAVVTDNAASLSALFQSSARKFGYEGDFNSTTVYFLIYFMI